MPDVLAVVVLAGVGAIALAVAAFQGWMDYERVIPSVDYSARTLARLLEH